MAAQAKPALSRDLGGGGSSSRGLSEASSPIGADRSPEVTRTLRDELGANGASREAEAQDKAPELSVRAVAALLLYFEQRYGRERLENLWRREGLGLTLAYLKVPTNYLSLRFLERLCDVLVRDSGDPQFCRKAGSFTATPEAIGFVFHAVKAFGSPRICYEKMIELSSTYNRVGSFVVEHIDDRQLTFSYQSSVLERNRNICELRMGQFASFPTIWNLPAAQVTELQCQILGAECCRYHVQ